MVTADPQLEKIIQAKIVEIDSVVNDLPVVVVIHKLPEQSLAYMSQVGLKLLGQKWEEIKNMTGLEYHNKYFNQEEANEYVPKIFKLLNDNSDKTVTFFQQVRTNPGRDWDWYLSSIKILLRDSNNQPLLSINISQKVDPNNVFTTKAVKLIEENIFIRRHFQEFAKLGKREVDVLRLLALGKSAVEIAKTLQITTATAETHRKNIRRKLKITNSYQITQFAQAFDLV